MIKNMETEKYESIFLIVLKEFTFINISSKNLEILKTRSIEKSSSKSLEDVAKYFRAVLYQYLKIELKTGRMSSLENFINALNVPSDITVVDSNLKLLDDLLSKVRLDEEEKYKVFEWLINNETIGSYIIQILKSLPVYKQDEFMASKYSENIFSLIELYINANGILIDNNEESRDIYFQEDIIKLYFQDAFQYPLLTYEEEKKLTTRYANGDEEAHNILVLSNLRMVVSIAKSYIGRGVSFPDLIQEGNMGLMKAIEKFDNTRGYHLSTYSYWWIRQYINRAIMDTGKSIRVPVHLQEKYRKIMAIKNRLTTILNREPSNEEIAVEIGMSAERVDEIIEHMQDTISLEMPIGEEKDSLFGEFIPDEKTSQLEDDVLSKMRSEELLEIIDVALTPKQAFVIKKRYGLDDGTPLTLVRVGEILGITRERVRQIELSATYKLKKFYKYKSKVKKNYSPSHIPKANPTPTICHVKYEGNFYDYFMPEYPKEEIDTAFSSLSSFHQQVVYKFYNSKFLSLGVLIISDEQKEELKTVIKYIRLVLKSIHNQKNLYEYFEGVDPNIVMLVCSCLSGPQQKIITKLFGKDFSKYQGIICDNLQNVEYQFMNYVLPELSKRIEFYLNSNSLEYEENSFLIGTRRHYGTSIYDMFYEYTPEEIDKVIALISNPNYLRVLKLKFGEEFNNGPQRSLKNSEASLLSGVIIPFITTNLKVNRKRKTDLVQIDLGIFLNLEHRPLDNIRELFKDYSLDLIQQAISSLSINDKVIFCRRYDDNLVAKTICLTKEEYYYLVTVIIPKIETEIKKLHDAQAYGSKYDSFYDYFVPKFTKEEVDSAFEQLSFKQKERIYKKYDKKFEMLPDVSLTAEEREEFNRAKKATFNLLRKPKELRKKVIKTKNVDKGLLNLIYYTLYGKESNFEFDIKEIKKIFDLFWTLTISKAMGDLTVIECIICAYKLKYINGTDKEIASFLEIKEEEIKIIYEKSIRSFKIALDHIIETKDDLTQDGGKKFRLIMD